MVVGLVLEKREKPLEDANPTNNLSLKMTYNDRNLVTQLMVQFIDGPKSKENL